MNAINAGTTSGYVVVMVCCLVGVILFAVRAKGGARVLGILGFALLFIHSIVDLVWFAAQGRALNSGGEYIHGAVALLSGLLGVAGLVCLAVSFVVKPRWESTRPATRGAVPGPYPGSGIPPDSGPRPDFGQHPRDWS